jgi:hypothetical protein
MNHDPGEWWESAMRETDSLLLDLIPPSPSHAYSGEMKTIMIMTPNYESLFKQKRRRWTLRSLWLWLFLLCIHYIYIIVFLYLWALPCTVNGLGPFFSALFSSQKRDMGAFSLPGSGVTLTRSNYLISQAYRFPSHPSELQNGTSFPGNIYMICSSWTKFTGSSIAQ